MAEQVPRPKPVAEEIAELCRSQDAVEAFLAKNGPRIDRAAVAITKQFFGYHDDRIATEIATKAMELLFRAATDQSLAARIKRAPSVMTWLHGVLRMMALEVRKGQLIGVPHVQIDEQLLASANDYAAEIVNHVDGPEIQRMIRECFKTLSESQTRVWTLIISNGGERPPSREIATTLGMAANVVDVHYKNGRDRLVQCLKKKGVTP